MTDLEFVDSLRGTHGLAFKLHDGDVFSVESSGLYYQVEGERVVGLAIRNKKVDDLSFLAEFQELRTLVLHSLGNPSIPDLSVHAALTRVALSHNKLTNLDCLAGSTGLTHLTVDNNRLVELPHAEAHPGLQSLIAYNNKFKTPAVVASLAGAPLRYLEMVFRDAIVGEDAQRFVELAADDGARFFSEVDVDLDTKQLKLLKKTCADLESLDVERIAGAVEILRGDEALRRRAEFRYGALVRGLTADPGATVLDFARAGLTQEVVQAVLEMFAKKVLDYGMNDDATIAKAQLVIGSIVEAQVEIDAFFDDLESLPSERLLPARWFFAEGVRDRLKSEARLVPSGWYSKIAKKIATFRPKSMAISHLEVALEGRGLMFFLGLCSLPQGLEIDVFQSNVAASATLWTLPNLPRPRVQQGGFKVPNGGRMKGGALRGPSDLFPFRCERGMTVR